MKKYVIDAQLFTYDEQGEEIDGPEIHIVCEASREISIREAIYYVASELRNREEDFCYWDHFHIEYIMPYVIN